jgi:hypothetical protein
MSILLVAIMKFKMADIIKSVNDIINALNGIPVSENVWFDTKIKRFDGLEPEICKSKIFNGRHNDIEKNGNIGFHTQYILTFPKIYSFTNPPKTPTKLHSEPDYF